MRKLKSILLSFLTLILASPVFAKGWNDGAGEAYPPTISGIGTILDKVMDIIFPVAGVVCVIFIIIGGYMWIASAGDPSKVKQAQGTLTWAIIGLIFVLVSTLIVRTIVNAL